MSDPFYLVLEGQSRHYSESAVQRSSAVISSSSMAAARLVMAAARAGSVPKSYPSASASWSVFCSASSALIKSGSCSSSRCSL